MTAAKPRKPSRTIRLQASPEQIDALHAVAVYALQRREEDVNERRQQVANFTPQSTQQLDEPEKAHVSKMLEIWLKLLEHAESKLAEAKIARCFAQYALRVSSERAL